MNECFEGMDGESTFTFESPSLEVANTIVFNLNCEDGSQWSCEHSYYDLVGVVDQPLEDHSTWDDVIPYFEGSY